MRKPKPLPDTASLSSILLASRYYRCRCVWHGKSDLHPFASQSNHMVDNESKLLEDTSHKYELAALTCGSSPPFNRTTCLPCRSTRYCQSCTVSWQYRMQRVHKERENNTTPSTERGSSTNCGLPLSSDLAPILGDSFLPAPLQLCGAIATRSSAANRMNVRKCITSCAQHVTHAKSAANDRTRYCNFAFLILREPRLERTRSHTTTTREEYRLHTTRPYRRHKLVGPYRHILPCQSHSLASGRVRLLTFVHPRVWVYVGAR